MKIVMVVAMSTNHAIGVEGGLPWRLSSDLRHFKRLTMGKPVVMGRRTYESIGRPLPDRLNIIVTRNRDYTAEEGCIVVNSLGEALEAAGTAEQVAVIGGGQLYKEALPLTDVIYLTWVHGDIEGDTFFEGLDLSQWEEEERQDFSKDDKNQYDFSFVTLRRIQSEDGSLNLRD